MPKDDIFSYFTDKNIDEETVEICILELLKRDKAPDNISDETKKSIWKCFIEAARVNMSTDQFQKKLGLCQKSLQISDVYNKYQDEILSILQTIRWDYDELVDFDWQISKINKSSLLGPKEQGENRASLQLKTLAAGETKPETFNVTFDEIQLQHFLMKLEEAQNTLENIRNK